MDQSLKGLIGTNACQQPLAIVPEYYLQNIIDEDQAMTVLLKAFKPYLVVFHLGGTRLLYYLELMIT